jgi:predicted metal-dependent peptidase
MSAQVAEDKKSYYQSLIDEQWDSIQAPNINLPALRNFIIRQLPFYAQALQLVDVVIVNNKKDVPSFGWTNGYKIFISPKHYVIHGMAVEKESGKKDLWFKTPELGITFTILHEIGHLVFDTFGRIQHREMRLWNVATDMQINQFVARLMKECSVFKTTDSYTQFMKVLEKNFVFDPAKYSKLSAEATYDDLYKSGKRGKDFEGWGLNGDLEGDGSGNEPGSKPLTAEEQMARDIIKSEFKNYTEKNASKLPGNGSGFGREFEMSLEPPKVNLRQVLKHITDRELNEDFGWDHRGSRMDHLMRQNIRLPVVMPNNPEFIRKVMVILDFSGSMSSEQCKDYLNIIREITCKHTRNPVHLIIHTSEVEFSGPIEDYTEVPTDISGGTAFKPVLEEIERLKKEERIIPSVLLWGTDLYGELQQSDYNVHNFPFHKKLNWIISGSDLEAPIGKTYWIDEVGS